MPGIPLPNLSLTGGPATSTAGANVQGSTIYAPFNNGPSVLELGLLVVAGIVALKLLKKV